MAHKLRPRYCSVLLYADTEEIACSIIDNLGQLNLNVGFREVYGYSVRQTWVFDFLRKEDYLIFCLKWNDLIIKTIIFDSTNEEFNATLKNAENNT